MLQLEQRMVRIILLALPAGKVFTVLSAHLKHGINRVVILDIDLHHGKPQYPYDMLRI